MNWTPEQMTGRIRQLEEVLAKYCHCRHANVDCFCVEEARAALWRDPAPDAIQQKSHAKPPERKAR